RYHATIRVVLVSEDSSVIKYHEVTSWQVKVFHLVFINQIDTLAVWDVDSFVVLDFPLGVIAGRSLNDPYPSHQNSRLCLILYQRCPAATVSQHQLQTLWFIALFPLRERGSIVLAAVVLQNFNL